MVTLVNVSRPSSGLARFGYAGLCLLGAMLVGYALYFYAGPANSVQTASENLSVFVRHPHALRVHAIAGSLAMLAGLVQFSPRGGAFSLRWHRRAGYLYFIAVLISSLAGLWLAPFSEGGLVAHYGFGALGMFWLATTAYGVRAAICGDARGHRRAMLRSLSLTCAAITLRLEIPLSSLAGLQFADFYPWVAWTCWVPNLAFAEYLLWRK